VGLIQVFQNQINNLTPLTAGETVQRPALFTEWSGKCNQKRMLILRAVTIKKSFIDEIETS